MRRFRKVGTWGALLAALTLALAGCIKLDMALEVSSDNTVSGSMIFAFQKSAMQAMGQDPKEMAEQSVQVDDSVEGVSAAPYDEGDFAGAKYTFDAVPLDDFNRTAMEDGGLVIEREGDSFVVSGEMDLSSGDTAGLEGMDQAFASAEIKIAITFPGEVTEANGNVSGNTVTWEPSLGEMTSFEATAGATGGESSSMMLLIVGGVILLIIIAVIVVLVSRGGKKVPPAAPEAAADASDIPPPPDAAETPAVPAAPEAPAVPDAPDAPADPGETPPES